SACSPSQSRVMVRSPILPISTAARSERPIKRWLSCVLPPRRPWMASRAPRSCVARGSIEYSAVIQPWPVPRRCAGTRSSTLAVTLTRVRPISITQEPSAYALVLIVMRTGRSSSGARPSCLCTLPSLLTKELQEQGCRFPEHVEGNPHEERRDRVDARRQQVGDHAEPDDTVEAVAV